MIKGRFFIANLSQQTSGNAEINFHVKFVPFSVVHTVKFAITEISRKWDCPSFLLLKAQKIQTVLPEVEQLAGLQHLISMAILQGY